MKAIVAVGLLVTVSVFIGCGDSATEINGTLPVVTGITVDTLASHGDTIVVTWTAMDTTLVDGYFLWTRREVEGPWTLAALCKNNAGVHIASRSVFYTVMAFKGDDTSSGVGLSANTKTVQVSEIRELFNLRPVGFRVDVTGDSIIAGNPASPEFAQQFVVAVNVNGVRYIYPGTVNPEQWPGGARTRIARGTGFIAPSPDDSILWKDSVSYGDDFFLAVGDGHYCLLTGTHTFPDTAAFTDTLVLKGQIQPIVNVRVFNEL
ncbi:MAG: hypothetical protein J7K88_08105 [Candidatus Fermentibacteraceae bacterium]|nr:hypothetical protein [Candidatus Fermentibacteraceae bacterium]